MNVNPLYWDSSFGIVLRLIETHPDVDVETVGTEQLNRWIIALPEFADDPSLVNEGILIDILREWYEEVSSL
ncbi:MAG: Fe-S cluster assembly protein IscX [Chloroflexi bacterium]|nr:Fe-S cluster assembly protein IscX [Chloroflexota bacterium]